MLQSIFAILRTEFSNNEEQEHSVRLDLKDFLEEEGYFFPGVIPDPVLGVKYDGRGNIEIELLYEAPDISKHIDNLQTILEKSISFVLPYISHGYSVEIRTDNRLAILVKANVEKEGYAITAIENLCMELFVMLTLYN